MAEDIELPGVGKVDQKYVLAAVGVLVGILAFAYWRRSQSPAPDAGYVIPDELVPDADYVNPGSSSNIPPQDLTGGSITTNEQWSQKATEHLGNLGFDPRVVASALGKFFQREGLDAVSMDAVKTAVGQLGPPPVGGPWPIKAADSTAPPPPTGGPVPLAKLSNLHVTGTGRDWIGLSWPPVPGAERYAVEVGGIAGVQHAGYDHVYGGTSYTIGGRVPGQEYTITVRAQRGDENGPGLTIRARTTS